MSQIDEFESAFKSADKPVFRFQPIPIASAAVVLDTNEAAATDFLDRTHSYLAHLQSSSPDFSTTLISGDHYGSVAELLERLKKQEPDLICTYRNLHIPATDYPFSLGVYIDVLTQVAPSPVLLLPRPELMNTTREYPSRPEHVVAVTDHLAGDTRLVSYAAKFTCSQGKLTLMHVEDELTYERFMRTISKIPDIDTDLARKTILDQLLKEPRDYIESCKLGIQAAGVSLDVDSLIAMGHRLSDYRALLRDRQVDLLVMNTKDEDQMAMHGLAYPLSVEIRKTPLLLI